MSFSLSNKIFLSLSVLLLAYYLFFSSLFLSLPLFLLFQSFSLSNDIFFYFCPSSGLLYLSFSVCLPLTLFLFFLSFLSNNIFLSLSVLPLASYLCLSISLSGRRLFFLFISFPLCLSHFLLLTLSLFVICPIFLPFSHLHSLF
jgi:hypothetical protein